MLLFGVSSGELEGRLKTRERKEQSKMGVVKLVLSRTPKVITENTSF